MWVRGLFSLSSPLWKWGAGPWGPRVDGRGERAQGECDGGAAWTSGPVLLQNLLASRCDHTTRSLFGEAVSAARGRGCLAAPPAPTLALAELTESPSRGGRALNHLQPTGEELETRTNGTPRDRAKGAGTCQTPASAQPSPSEWVPDYVGAASGGARAPRRV